MHEPENLRKDGEDKRHCLIAVPLPSLFFSRGGSRLGAVSGMLSILCPAHIPGLVLIPGHSFLG